MHVIHERHPDVAARVVAGLMHPGDSVQSSHTDRHPSLPRVAAPSSPPSPSLLLRASADVAVHLILVATIVQLAPMECRGGVGSLWGLLPPGSAGRPART